MRVTLLCVGGIKGPLAPAVTDYEERSRRYWKLDVVEVEGGLRKAGPAGSRQVMAAEGERILGRLPNAGEVVALTRKGRELDSVQLAERMEEWALRSVPSVTFVLGGAFGLDRSVLERATLRLSLSPMTLPHEIARLLMAEQLYRTGTILRGEPYHKGS